MRYVFFCLFLSPTFCLGADSLCVREVLVPGYPVLARVAKLQGSIVVELEIGRQGKILSAKASGGHKFLMREAEKNVLHWSFAPLPESEKVPLKHTITYVYKLEGKPVDYNPVPTVLLHLPDRVEITTRPLAPQTSRPPPP